MTDLLTPVYLVALAIGLAAALLQAPTARRVAGIGALLAALGAGALALAPGDGPVTTLLARATLAGLPRYVLAINGGLLMAGVALLLGAGALQGSRAAPPTAEARAAGLRQFGEALGELAALALALLLSLWAGLVVLGVLAWRLGSVRRWLLPLGVLPLTALGWYAATVGDAWRLPLDGWTDVPISAAGARVAAAPVALAALAWSAAAGTRGGSRVAWVAPLLFGWPGLALGASGLEALGPVLLPVAVALTAAAAWQRAGWAAVGVAVSVLVLAQPEVTLAALALPVLLAVALGAREVAWVGPITAGMLAAAGVLVLPSALRGEFVWTLALLGVLGVVAWRSTAVSAPAPATAN